MAAARLKDDENPVVAAAAAEVKASAVEAPPLTPVEVAKKERREAEAPVRSEYALGAAEWAVQIVRTSEADQQTIAAVLDGYLRLMTLAPGAGDGQVAAHVARVRGELNDWARTLGRIATVAGDLAAAAG